MDRHDLVAVNAERAHLVDAVLQRFFSLSKKRAHPLGAHYEHLWGLLERNTQGGKRFRPRMVMAAYAGLGGTDMDAAAYVGAAFELLHTALIVHDDVIDRDFVRRGIPNISGAYRDSAVDRGVATDIAEHRGVSAAIIAGDLALFNAYRLIDKSGVGSPLRERIVEVLDEAMFASAAGELIDVDFSIDPGMPLVDDILTMERLKTAVYSFETPLQAGAILAGADEAVVTTLGDFGREIGIAYQVIDDVLGVFGEEEATGKTTIGDLREGKRTAMIAFASSTPSWSRLSELVGHADLTAAQADEARSLLVECGARAFADDLARGYAQRALTRLAEPWVPDTLRAELHPVAETVLDRVR